MLLAEKQGINEKNNTKTHLNGGHQEGVTHSQVGQALCILNPHFSIPGTCNESAVQWVFNMTSALSKCSLPKNPHCT